jgi:hypothetical protein
MSTRARTFPLGDYVEQISLFHRAIPRARAKVRNFSRSLLRAVPVAAAAITVVVGVAVGLQTDEDAKDVVRE